MLARARPRPAGRRDITKDQCRRREAEPWLYSRMSGRAEPGIGLGCVLSRAISQAAQVNKGHGSMSRPLQGAAEGGKLPSCRTAVVPEPVEGEKWCSGRSIGAFREIDRIELASRATHQVAALPPSRDASFLVVGFFSTTCIRGDLASSSAAM